MMSSSSGMACSADTPRAPVVVRYDDVAPVRWANGRGWTRVIHESPGADDERPNWRLSIAVIDVPGPFSTFPRMRRHLVSASRRRLRLRIAGMDREVQYGEPIAFDGTTDVEVTEVEGPVEVINLMTRSDIEATIQMIPAQGLLRLSCSDAVAVVVIEGHADVAGSRLSAHDTLVLGPHDTEVRCTAAVLACIMVRSGARVG